jgi:hypothetical protein
MAEHKNNKMVTKLKYIVFNLLVGSSILFNLRFKEDGQEHHLPTFKGF